MGLAEPPVGGKGTLAVDRTAIDFGTLGKHQARQRTLHVRNGTDRTIRITGRDSDCTFLNSQTESQRLPPGGSTAWQIDLNRCDHASEVRRHVRLETDCQAARIVKVAVCYRVVPALFVEPGFVWLGFLTDDATEPVEATVEVRTLEEEGFRLLGAWSDNPVVEAIIEQDSATTDNPGRVCTRVYPPMPIGPFQPTVWVMTDSTDVPKLRIPVFGESISGLRCDRRAVVFEGVPRGATRSQVLTLYHDDGVRIGEIRKSNETVDITAIERSPGRLVITLRTSQRLQLGSFRGHLTINVRHTGRSRKVKLPFRGSVTESAPVCVSTANCESSTGEDRVKSAGSLEE